MKNNLKQEKGITLIALVITIVVLLILAGVTIAMLTGENGILGKATTAKNKNDEASVEEKIKLSVMYARMNTNGDTNINLDELEKELEKNFDDVNISKKGANEALPWIVTSNGYMFEITENEEVTRINGIALDKSNIKLIQGGTETITAELTQGVTGTITWTSDNENVTVTGNDKTAQIEVKENATGTATITAKIGTEYSATCKVNVVSKVGSISVDNFEIGVEEEKEIKIKTTPSDNVEELTYTYKVGNPDVVTVDKSGKVKGIAIGTSTIKITGTGKLSNEQVTAQCEVEVTKQLVSVTAQKIAANPKAYYGKKVENYKVSEEDTNTYRIFYVNTTANEFGDEAYTIYLKVDSNGYEKLEAYESYDKVNTKIKVMNPKWANGITSDSDVTTRGDSESNWKTNEKAAAYLCSPVDANNYNNTSLPWKTYYKQNDENVNYVIGGPSVEMYVKSYNNAYNGIINDTSRYPLGTNYSKTAVNGYVYTINNNQTSDYSTGSIIDYTNYNGMYCRSYQDYWWLASPSAKNESALCCVQSWSAHKELNSPEIISTASCLSPIISLKSSFQPLVER